MPKLIVSNNDYTSKLEALIELAHTLKQESDFKQILQIITEKARVLFASDFTLLMMTNPQTQHTIRTVFSGQKNSRKTVNHAINSSISGWVIKFKNILLSRDIRKDERFRKNLVEDCIYKSVLCSPLYSEGIVIGTLLLARKNKQSFNEQEMEYLNQFSAVVSPFMRNEQKIQQYFSNKIPEKSLFEKYEKVGLTGKSHRFVELLQALETASKSDIRVLIEGDSGTGKELVAKAIHQFSSRGQGNFVAMDCGSIPDTLIESELFGHVKGAFTGATDHHTGLIQQANNGTLFLDEIENIPMNLQKKLLRFLQEAEIRPIGSSLIKKVNVRIISASGKSLYQMVEENNFREDLFYRLYVYPIKVPALNERKEDIPLLAHYFLKKFAKQQRKKLKSFHEQVMGFMKQNTWRGNVRELENFVERMVTVIPTDVSIIRYDSLPAGLKKTLQSFKSHLSSDLLSKSLKEQLHNFETDLIREILIECSWNQSLAARKLNISESNIRYKINQLGIQQNE